MKYFNTKNCYHKCDYYFKLFLFLASNNVNPNNVNRRRDERVKKVINSNVLKIMCGTPLSIKVRIYATSKSATQLLSIIYPCF